MLLRVLLKRFTFSVAMGAYSGLSFVDLIGVPDIFCHRGIGATNKDQPL